MNILINDETMNINEKLLLWEAMNEKSKRHGYIIHSLFHNHSKKLNYIKNIECVDKEYKLSNSLNNNITL